MLCAMITHNDSPAIASAVAFVALIWELLAMNAPPAPGWWRSRFITVLRQLECRNYKPRSPIWRTFMGGFGACSNRSCRVSLRKISRSSTHVTGGTPERTCWRRFRVCYRSLSDTVATLRKLSLAVNDT